MKKEYKEVKIILNGKPAKAKLIDDFKEMSLKEFKEVKKNEFRE